MKIKIKDPLHKSDNNDNINSNPVPTQPECCAVARCHAYHLLGQLLYSSTQLRPLFSLRKKTSLGYDARPKIWPHQYFISPTSNGGAARRPKNKYRLKELTSETVHYPLCRSVLICTVRWSTASPKKALCTHPTRFTQTCPAIMT